MKGMYKPLNPQKYKGNPTAIVYRSSWEYKFMLYLDRHKDIIEWNSESIIVPYKCKTDNKLHRYYVDFFVKRKTLKGEIKESLIEIKPLKETLPPIKPKKQTKRFIKEVMTYAKNISKWEAAREYCKKRNMDFLILTENELGI